MHRIARAVVLLSPLLVLLGCKRDVPCNPADSNAVCKEFQQCLRSGTSTEVCRMGEQDANKVSNGTNQPQQSPPQH